MKFFSHLTSLFKAPVPPLQEEIEAHLRRLNVLVLAYQDVKTLADWIETHRETELELQWFDIHHLKLTSTLDPILTTGVHSDDAIAWEANSLSHKVRAG